MKHDDNMKHDDREQIENNDEEYIEYENIYLNH